MSEEYMQDLLSEYNTDFMLTYRYSMDVYAMNLEGYETETNPGLWKNQLEQTLEYLSKVLEENTGEGYQLHATRKDESETFWNGSQEYAAEKFWGGVLWRICLYLSYRIACLS